MTGQAVLAALLAAVGAAMVATTLVRGRVQLADRIEPYAQRTRSQLGTVIPERAQGPRTVWGPMVTTLADSFARLIGGGIDEQRLRQAGMADMTVDDAHRQQLAFTAAGVGLGVVMALFISLGATGSLLLVIIAGLGGYSNWRSRIDRAIRLRSERLSAETHVMCQILAVYLRTGDNPQPAVERLVRRSSGEVSQDLGRAVSLIRSGSVAGEVFERTPKNHRSRNRLACTGWSAQAGTTAATPTLSCNCPRCSALLGVKNSDGPWLAAVLRWSYRSR